MASRNYWDKRMSQLLDAQDKKDLKFTRKMAKEYDRTAAAIDKDIAAYYAKYAVEDVIEYRKLVERLSKDERDLLYKNYDAFAEKYPEYKSLMPIRESIYRLNRLEGLQISIQQHLLDLGAIEQEEFRKHLTAAIETGYLSTMRDLQNSTSFFGLNSAVLEKTLNSRWVNEENFSDRIWGNKQKLVRSLNSEVRDAFIRGEGYAAMTKIIQNRTGVGKYAAKRLVMTESAFMMTQANGQAFMDEGILRYGCSAVGDSKTSEFCQNIDGKEFLFKEAKVGINYPPFHSFCRTTVYPVEND
ncbi:minor capsid protein [Planococcus sp. A6]|uniref:minor capsid protein n=1 Tax=Planococcus sp. A6 TaxID=2992760 RepID=UPI00237C1D2A|nr:minor capsid protein [Planococcus sp. A6]MDE0582230.1 minor capsid protein [Planococcus sp. A6]